MAATELEIKFFAAGCCYQSSRLVLPGSAPRRLRFPALVVRMRHPKHGIVLFDTGYAQRVLDRCHTLPERILPALTPIEIAPTQTATAHLAAEGIAAEEVRHVIVSHFHADHIGGLEDFPRATVHCHLSSLQRLRTPNRWRTMRHGVIAALLPKPTRDVRDVMAAPRVRTGLDFLPEARDLFNDGSIFLVELPGHADGQIGAIITGPNRRRFLLVSDACWVREAWHEMRMPANLTRPVHRDFSAYRQTLQRLNRFHQKHPDVTIVPSHCEQTLMQLQSEGL